MHKRGRATSRITSGEQLQRLNRKSSPGSREHYQAFTSVRIWSGQRRVRAPVFTGASCCAFMVTPSKRSKGAGLGRHKTRGSRLPSEREGGVFKLRTVFIKLFSPHHAGMERLHLGDSAAVREEVVETLRLLIVTTWDTNAACHCRHQGWNLQELDKSPTVFAAFSTAECTSVLT